MFKVSEKIASKTRGNYVMTNWNVVAEDGTPYCPPTLSPGRFIVVENAHALTVLRVNADMTLEECDVE